MARDRWSGGRDKLLALWPGEKFTPDHHEHAHAEGCYYAHKHTGGREPHEHESRPDGQGRSVRRLPVSDDVEVTHG